jgi:uncharacterized protein
MWTRLGDFIIRHRISSLVFIGLLTLFMGWQGRKAELLQEFVKVIPADDPEYQEYLKFKATFGEDGNSVIVGLSLSDSARAAGRTFFEPSFLNDLWRTSQALDSLEYVDRVLNLTQVFDLQRDDAAQRFQLSRLMPSELTSPAEADSLRRRLLNLPFYRGLLINADFSATVVVVSLDQRVLVTKSKHSLIRSIERQLNDLAARHQMRAHFSGVPFIRSYISQKLPAELGLFVCLAALVTAIALYFFYRSFYAVIFPMILLGIATVCTFGLVGILGYKLSAITGLIPPIIIILGIPPCIYMLSDYHREYVKTGNKLMSIRAMIHRLGLVTFMINANTAFGFLTLYFTNVVPLKEFGMLAFLSTLLTYLLTIFMIPGIFSLLPPPSAKRLRYLDSRIIRWMIERTQHIVQHQRPAIYGLAVVLTGLSIWGMTRLQAVSYMVDDLPDSDRIYSDLRFMEKNFDGVMPFEVVVDTRQRNGLRKLSTLRKLDRAQQVIANYPDVSRTLSFADAIKWSRQAYFGGDSAQYSLPIADELVVLDRLSRRSRGEANERGVLSTLVDSTYRYARITGLMRDVGSQQMPVLLKSLNTDLDAIFNAADDPRPAEERASFTVTGTTKIFLKANDYLISNLFWSLIATFLIVGVQMFILFNSARIMILSMVPNLIPLAMTAGIMGFMEIELKPSTALIYGIAFGIAIDNSIHFLASYRHTRRAGLSIHQAVLESLEHTGLSVIYTSVVLFVGFVIFSPSAFGSTRALGILTSVTLLIALFSNLVLLPALLMTFDREKLDTTAALIDDEEAELPPPTEPLD